MLDAVSMSVHMFHVVSLQSGDQMALFHIAFFFFFWTHALTLFSLRYTKFMGCATGAGVSPLGLDIFRISVLHKN